MRVFVTGADGLIGRHVTRFYEEAGWEVSGCDLKRGSDALDFFRREDTVYDRVVHAAYIVGGRAMIDGINDSFMHNQELDSAFFRWAIRTKQKRLVYFSSSAAYPVEYQTQYYQTQQYATRRLHEDLIDLSDTLQPDAYYGWSKLSGERMASATRANGIPVSVLRPFSGYWYDQDDSYPFPAIVRRARQGDLTVWGPQGQSRDWIAIPDVIAGMHAVVESETTDPVNLCSGVATEMGELAMKIAVQAGFPDDCEDCQPKYDESKPYGVFYRVGDPTRMLKYYTPKVSLEEGIRRALAQG